MKAGCCGNTHPAKLADNPTQTENDPHYAARLSGMDAALVRAMLSMVTGTSLPVVECLMTLWSDRLHVLKPVRGSRDHGESTGRSIGVRASRLARRLVVKVRRNRGNPR